MQKRAARPETNEENVEVAPAPQAATEDTDELLDEIDAILEDQEALTRYRQKGGE